MLDTQTYQDIYNAVDSLKNSNSTKYYFAEDNPFEPIERCYQLKFKATLDGIDYRCMFDKIWNFKIFFLSLQHDNLIIN